MVLWEYLVEGGPFSAGLLNKQGLEGWELVAVENGVAYFKRPFRWPAPERPKRTLP